jgi:hypothetical protein
MNEGIEEFIVYSRQRHQQCCEDQDDKESFHDYFSVRDRMMSLGLMPSASAVKDSRTR